MSLAQNRLIAAGVFHILFISNIGRRDQATIVMCKTARLAYLLLRILAFWA